MKKVRLLFISYAFYPKIGGIEVNAQILTSHLHQLGYDIRLITMVKEKGEKTFPFPVYRNPGIVELYKLHKWADIVFENQPSLRLSWPRIFFSAKSVIVLHGRISRVDGSLAFQDKLKRFALDKADGVIAVSKLIRDNFYPKATVIGNPYRDELFKNLGTKREALSFVFLGRLVSEKGVHIAIESIKKLKEELAYAKGTLTLKIIGDGPELENLQELVKSYKLENEIIFEGRKQGRELVEILNSGKYILIPSKLEAFGNVALEGMACGCLPFVSDDGGLVEAVGDAGIKFKAGSSEALADAVLGILSNPEFEASLRAKMKSHLEEHYAERVVQKYLVVIEKAYRKK